MIGAQSGKWYMYDGIRWVPDDPRRRRNPSPPRAIPHRPQSRQPLPQAPAPQIPSSPPPRQSNPGKPAAALKDPRRSCDSQRGSLSSEAAANYGDAAPFGTGAVLAGCAVLAVVLAVLAFW